MLYINENIGTDLITSINVGWWYTNQRIVQEVLTNEHQTLFKSFQEETLRSASMYTTWQDVYESIETYKWNFNILSQNKFGKHHLYDEFLQ